MIYDDAGVHDAFLGLLIVSAFFGIGLFIYETREKWGDVIAKAVLCVISGGWWKEG